MKLYDCFLFNDEIELLELRLEETKDVVDKWVVVECGMNWQQKKKPLFFKENAARFEAFKERIHHVVIEEHPIGPYPVIEWYQRRFLETAWKQAGAVPGDLIMVSDADEIPDASTLEAIKVDPPTFPVVLQQYLFYYSVDCIQMQPWNGPIVFTLADEEHDVQKIRDARNSLPIASPGGWHFSWLGPLDRLQYKLNCHTVKEDSGGAILPPDPKDEAFLTDCLLTGKDLFSRSESYAQKRFVEIAPGTLHPNAIVKWLHKYPEFTRRHLPNADAEVLLEQHGIL